MHRRSQWFTNTFIVCMISLLLIDGLPTWVGPHVALRERLIPYVRGLGLEQNGWQLFAPEPDSWNLRITAKATYPNGTSANWQSPDWSKTSSWQKVRLARHINYYEYLADDESSLYWPYFADAMRERMPLSPDGQPPKRIELTQHWAEVPAPTPGTNWQPVPETIPFTWIEPFFVREYP